MSQKLLSALAAVLVLSCGAPAHAGPLPISAEDFTVGDSSLITGTLDDQFDVDMFKIHIVNFADFSAITTALAFGIPDTELFLFDASGLGVYANDDISFSDTLSCLPSADSLNPCSSTRPPGVGPIANGIYYLAITRSANGPVSVDGEIFTFLSSTDVVGPDLTMGGASPIVDWDGGVFTNPDTDLVNFSISLTGTVPEPGPWALLITGLGFFLVRRKHLTPR